MQRPITCIPTGVHWGCKRFPSSEDQPTLKPWRCNLTSLSQIYNLYFVACNDTIHVYQPRFPDQNLASEPELILHPPVVSNIAGQGIDPVDPHSITRLHIDYLGQDEIMLVTCDDGDVIAYRVEHIQATLDRRRITQEGRLEPANDDDIKIFLRRNVGASAWGLAVHREARIIAISANTHDITVIAFALADAMNSPEPLAPQLLTDSRFKQALKLPISRQKDYVITLRADSNTPAVSFNNNGDDPTGRWLTSSSIDGKTIVWDLHGLPDRSSSRPARVIKLGWCASANPATPRFQLDSGDCLCVDRTNHPHGAWGALTLNTRAAYEMPYDEALLQRPELIAPCFKDITRDIKRFSVGTTRDFDSSPELTMDDSPDEDEETNIMKISESDSEGGALTAQSGLDQSQLPSTSASSSSMSIDDHEEPVKESEENEEEDKHGEEGEDEDDNDSELNLHESSSEAIEMLNSAELISSGGELFIFPPIAERYPYCDVSPLHDYFSHIGRTEGPSLLVTKEDIYLLQHSFSRPLLSVSDETHTVCMRRPLRPEPGLPFLASADRMCYLSHIPELGVFIVASPTGRAGVFSIYWTKEKSDAQPEWGFRLEYLLPFEKRDDQEVYGVSDASLIGVAVGPIQGMFDQPGDVKELPAEGPRRWRVLLYYTDHTLLCFELSKSRSCNSPSLSDLIV